MLSKRISLQESPTQKYVYDIVEDEHLLGTCYIRPGIKQIKLFKMVSLYQMVYITQVILDEHERLVYFTRNQRTRVNASVPTVS